MTSKLILKIYFLILIYYSFAIDINKTNSNTCLKIKDIDREDCFPENNSNEELCLKRGCCWNHPSQNFSIGIPYCFYPSDYNGYHIAYVFKIKKLLRIDLRRNSNSGFPLDYQSIQIQILFLNKYSLQIKIKPNFEQHFEVPINLNLNQNVSLNTKDTLYKVDFDINRIYVYRKSSGKIIWSANINTIVFSNQFLQISTDINSKKLFGLAEHQDNYEKTIKNYKKIVFFNKDEYPKKNLPLYGSHPVYLSYEQEISKENQNIKTQAHTVFLLNSNAIELVLSPKPNLQWRSLGGILDFYINLGPTPKQAVSQYVSLVGKPPLPPLWGLGFHLCRFGYNSLNNTRNTAFRTIKAKIPFDVQWNDIDFMDKRNLFTIDNVNFAGLKEFVNELHSINMKYVPIFDPGLGTNFSVEEYPSYYDGLKKDVFIKNKTLSNLEAKVWNKFYTVFVDFTKKEGQQFWIEQMKLLHDKIGFDGSWNDMNEIAASNQYVGSRYGCDWRDSYEKPYYIPDSIKPLYDKTICMTAKLNLSIYYNLHNLYAYFEVKTVNEGLRFLKKRPFIISRATFPGIGKFGSHWSGDVFSSWDHLKYSISNMLEFNILGIPLVGSDICGFNGNTTVKLCARWHSVGAFYPFSRNHNTNNAIDQDPVALGDVVVKAARNALRIRYSLISVLYTEFFYASQYGTPVARSLSFVFPDDENSYNFENQFFWGDSILIIPVVTDTQEPIDAYFPPGIWYDYSKHIIWSNSSIGIQKKILIPLTEILVAVRGGAILPTHLPEQTTKVTVSNPFNLIVALDLNKYASGNLYYDDGESYNIAETQAYTLINFEAKNNSITSKVILKNYANVPKLNSSTILSLDRKVTKVFVFDKEVNYKQEKGILYLKNLNLNLLEPIEIKWEF